MSSLNNPNLQSSSSNGATPSKRGKLKIFMGYAAGVGKTFAMLEESQHCKETGTDIVIGYFEPHGRAETIAKTEGLEMIQRKVVDYRGSPFEEMDTDAILARHPQVCAVDEFPHTNVPGSPRDKRWQDVEVLLAHGIDVLTTMNIQHLEGLNDQIENMSGVRVRETVPDWVVQQADEVVMVDLTPRALLHRLQRGVVYERHKAERAMQNFFRESTLVALRELALRQAAHEVESRIADTDEPAPRAKGRDLPPSKKILILATAHPKTAMLIRRAKRISDFVGAECFAVAVQPTGDLSTLEKADREAIERHLNFARNLHIETHILEGDDVASTLLEFGRSIGITQIYLARPQQRPWLPFLDRDPVSKILALVKDLEIVIVSDRDPSSHNC